MLNEECDILIVGAGPAGASAACAAARAGLGVIVAERRAAVGVPVQCAEYIPAPLLGQAGVARDVVVQKIAGMRTHVPGCDVKHTVAPGFIVARDRFDQALVAKAREAGADVRLATRVVTFDPDKGQALLTCAAGRRSVRYQVLIGADGPHSAVGRRIGLVNKALMPAAQLKMKLVRPLAQTEVYLDPDIYAGYGWLFPRGQWANIGLGVKRRARTRVSLKQLLLAFKDRLVQDGRIMGEPKGYTGGWIPAAPLKATVKRNVMLAGDAAGQTHPITGAGIFAAVSCGAMAGKWAAKAVQAAHVSQLAGYERQWRDLWADTLTRAHQRRQFMEARWSQFDRIIKSCWVAFREYYAEPDLET